jgi:hypothetical protein
MVREHPHKFVREAARRERDALAYVLFVMVMFVAKLRRFSGGHGDGPIYRPAAPCYSPPELLGVE